MITIYWAGDSTSQQNSMKTYPQTGIAQAFHRYAKRFEVCIANHAVNARSTRSFIDEGRLAPIYDNMKAGDFLFIQFGHNDEKEQDPARYCDPETDYAMNLEKFVNAARNKHAIPVIITPLCRRLFAVSDEIYRHTAWAEAARKTAARLNAACIDLTALSEAYVNRIGPEAAASLYMQLLPGIYENYPNGQTDNTHLQEKGALVFAGIIADELLKLGEPYASLIEPDYILWKKKHETVDAETAREKWSHG